MFAIPTQTSLQIFQKSFSCVELLTHSNNKACSVNCFPGGPELCVLPPPRTRLPPSGSRGNPLSAIPGPPEPGGHLLVVVTCSGVNAVGVTNLGVTYFRKNRLSVICLGVNWLSEPLWVRMEWV